MSRRTPPRVELLEDRVTPATLEVTTLADLVDGDTSNSAALLANRGADGAISLTEAMRAADADPDETTIVLPGGPEGAAISLTGSTIDPRSLADDPDSVGPSQYVVTTPINLFISTPFEGPRRPGPAIVRFADSPAFRLFDVRAGGNLHIDAVELQNGLALGGSGFDGGGGAAGLGGAIFNRGTLWVSNSTLTGNTAQGGAGSLRDVESFAGGGGGGLGASADGFDGGSPNGGEGTGEGTGDPGGFGGGGGGGTSGGDGGFGGGGGAGNAFFGEAGTGGFGAGSGAGVSSGSGSGSGGPVTTPGGFGGAAGVGASGGGGAGMGGAIFNHGGSVRVTNSTFVGNGTNGGISGDGASRGTGLGGSIFNLEGTVAVASSTFASAYAVDDGAAIYNLAATGSGEDAVLTISNSILADSTADAVVVNQRLVSDGANAVVTATDPSITDGGGFRNDGGDADTSGVITATRPVVAAALAYNGGPTRTLLPTPDSEAIDAGTAAPSDGAGGTLLGDQRDFVRPSGASSDLGAVEVRVELPPAPGVPLDTVVFTSPDGVTVRNALPGAAAQTDPFPGFAGDTRVAVADLDGDGFDDYVYAPGAGGGPHIRIIDGRTGAERLSFFGFTPDFRGGVFLAIADINGDTFPDVIASAGDGGGPHIRVFDGRTGAELASFFAADPAGRGGVSVSAGDVTGDGVADIVVGAGVNGDGTVRVIDGTKLNLLDASGRILPAAVAVEFQPYGGAFAPGLAVAVGRFDNDRFADVAAGPLWRAEPRVFVRSGPNLANVSDFSPSVGGGLDTGLRMVAADQTGDGLDELVLTAGPGGGPHTEVIDPLTGRVLESYFTFDPNSRTGFGVG